MNTIIEQEITDDALRIHNAHRPITAVRTRKKDGRTFTVLVTFSDGSKRKITGAATMRGFYYAGVFTVIDSEFVNGHFTPTKINLRTYEGAVIRDLTETRQVRKPGEVMANNVPLAMTCIAVTGEAWAPFFTDAERTDLQHLVGRPLKHVHEGQLQRVPEVRPGQEVRFYACGYFRVGRVVRRTKNKVLVGFAFPSNTRVKTAWIKFGSIFHPRLLPAPTATTAA